MTDKQMSLVAMAVVAGVSLAGYLGDETAMTAVAIVGFMAFGAWLWWTDGR